MSEHAGPIADSYWAEPNQLLAGPLPQGKDKPELRASIRALLDAGVRTVLDLRTPLESPGIRVLLNKLAKEDEGVAWINVPILNGAAPTPSELTAILDLIDSSIARDKPVYVHCQGGLGRTGTAVAAWWIRHDKLDYDGAMDELTERRVGQPHGHMPSPETAPQLRLLKSWKPGL